MISVFSAFLAIAVMTVIRAYIQRIRRSSLDNIPGPAPTSLLTGVYSAMFNDDAWGFHKDLNENYGGIVKIKALFGKTELYVTDPAALQQIFGKDQNLFEETPYFITLHQLLFGEGLLATLGNQHRKQRKMLNPVFSTNNLRNMVPEFYDIVYKFRDAFAKVVPRNEAKEVDVLSWTTRVSLEIICRNGLGRSVDPFTEDIASHPYSAAAKMLIPTLSKMQLAVALFMVPLSRIGSPSFRRYVINSFPWKALQDMKDIVNTMYAHSIDIFNSHKKGLVAGDRDTANQIEQGKDIMSILMHANMSAAIEDSLTYDELLGQISTFTFAAMDTTSVAMTRVLYLLAENPDAQERLREEIIDARNVSQGDLNYDELIALPYLTAVYRETLRLHPPITFLSRITKSDTVLNLSNPIKGLDGRTITDVHVPKDTQIWLGIMASNRNPDIWGPDSEEWKPERWLEPLPDTVSAARLPGIYSNLMTFSGGSRSCIGFKFAELEMKMVLLLLIESFKFSLSDKEILWRMSAITTSTVAGSRHLAPELPLLVQRVHSSG